MVTYVHDVVANIMNVISFNTPLIYHLRKLILGSGVISAIFRFVFKTGPVQEDS